MRTHFCQTDACVHRRIMTVLVGSSGNRFDLYGYNYLSKTQIYSNVEYVRFWAL